MGAVVLYVALFQKSAEFSLEQMVWWVKLKLAVASPSYFLHGAPSPEIILS